MNFVRDVVEAADPRTRALVELARDGTRRSGRSGRSLSARRAWAGRWLPAASGAATSSSTLIGNRPEWVLTMVACFRIGAVALPCTEQLRARDLRLRLDAARPALIVCDERNRAELEQAAPDCPVAMVPDERLFAGPPAGLVESGPDEPCLITFTSGTSGLPKGSSTASATSPGSSSRQSTGSAPGGASWSGARLPAGGRESARNVFVAPWMRGAAALLHDARFDPHERIELLRREQVDVLCMAPTEYRTIAKRAEIPAPAAALAGRRGRGAQSGGRAAVAASDRAHDPRRLRSDGDRPADGDTRTASPAARLDGPWRCRGSG